MTYCHMGNVFIVACLVINVSTGQHKFFKIDPNQPPGCSHSVKHCYCKIQKRNIFVQNNSYKFPQLCC